MEYNGGQIEISDNVLKEIVFRNLADHLNVKVEDTKTVKKLRKMIQISRTPEDHVVVNIKGLAVPYGERIPDFVGALIKRIKDDIERMTEIPVEAVNVEVADVVEKEKMEETFYDEEEEKTTENES